MLRRFTDAVGLLRVSIMPVAGSTDTAIYYYNLVYLEIMPYVMIYYWRFKQDDALSRTIQDSFDVLEMLSQGLLDKHTTDNKIVDTPYEIAYLPI